MAKKGSIGAFKKANRQDLMGDLNYTQSQLAAISGNLLTTGKGLARGLTADQARQIAAIQRVSAKGVKRIAGIVQGGQEAVANRYGSAIAGAAQPDFLTALGTAKAAGSITAGAVKQAKGTAAAGQASMDIMQSAASEAASGAQYAMAVALKSRAQTDASQAAAMQFELQKMRLQHTLDLKGQKEWLLFTQKQEQKLLGGLKGATETADQLAALIPSLRIAMQDPKWGTDTTHTMAAWETANIPPSLQSQWLELRSRINSRGLFQGVAGQGAVVSAIVDSMIATNPELLKMRDSLEQTALASLGIAWNSSAMSELDTGGSSLDLGTIGKYAAGGAAIGAAAGLLGGPFAEVTVPAGIAAGAGIGLVGGIVQWALSGGGGTLTETEQQHVADMKKAGKSDKEISAYIKSLL